MREIRWKTYAVALIITIFIFGTGIIVGTYVAQGANASIENELSDVRESAAELEMLSLLGNDARLCSYYATQLGPLNEQVTAIDRRVDALGKGRGVTDSDYLKLKREFMTIQLRDYLTTERMNTNCNTSIDTLLYFYAKDCADCGRQGAVGPELKAMRPDLRIYAFDADINSTVVAALLARYNVKAMPTLVANGAVLQGYHSKDEILAQLNR